MNKIMMIVGLILAAAAPALAGGGEDILGIWNDEEKIVQIEIYQCGDKYCGKLVWLKEPNYPAGSKEGAPGTPRVDHNNPDPAQRKTPLFGLVIMRGFTFRGDNSWSGGTLYDPKTGNTYRGKMTLVSPHELKLRGFVGIPLFGRTSTWTR
jgi:uncharacterized protein (DUF2147 family)